MALVFALASCEKETGGDNPIREVIIVSQNIITNTTWYGDKTYHVTNSIDITNSAVLTIQPGTIIIVDKDVEIDVAYSDYGSIIAHGTKELPILFTSSAPNKNKGDWFGFWIYDGAAGTEFDYCIFEYSGGYAASQATINLRDAKIGMRNCTIRESESFGFELRNDGSGFTFFDNNTITATIYDPIKMPVTAVGDLGVGNTFDAGKRIEVNRGFLDLPGTYTWKKQAAPYYFSDDVLVGAVGNVELIIEPGTELQFGADVEFGVGDNPSLGSVNATGTPAMPIIFTSAFPVQNAGDWDGIWIYEGLSNTCVFDNCLITYGGGYSYGGNITLRHDVGNMVSISNCEISNSKEFGIYKKEVNAPTLINNTFINNAKGDKNW